MSNEAIHPEDFGAIGDGQADDTEAIQAAIDAAQPGQTVAFKTGGACRITRPITVASPVTLEGR